MLGVGPMETSGSQTPSVAARCVLTCMGGGRRKEHTQVLFVYVQKLINSGISPAALYVACMQDTKTQAINSEHIDSGFMTHAVASAGLQCGDPVRRILAVETYTTVRNEK